MEPFWLPIVAVLAIFAVMFFNSYYSIKKKKISLARSLLTRLIVIVILVAPFGYYTGNYWIALGFIAALSVISIVHILWVDPLRMQWENRLKKENKET